jgi:hypothetical protein
MDEMQEKIMNIIVMQKSIVTRITPPRDWQRIWAQTLATFPLL